MAGTETPMQFVTVIEDDPDVQLLIETIFSMDARFRAANAAETAEEVLESARTTEPGSSYSDDDLAWWADRFREWEGAGQEVYAYFNNDGGGNAVHNARRLRELLES